MKKFIGIVIIMLIIMLALVFTVPTQTDFENYIVEKVKEEAYDDAIGLNDFLIQNISQFAFFGAEYKNVKVGSIYAFSLGKGKEYKFVGFGTLIICVEGDLSVIGK